MKAENHMTHPPYKTWHFWLNNQKKNHILWMKSWWYLRFRLILVSDYIRRLVLFLPVSYAKCVCLWGLIRQKQLSRMAATTWVRSPLGSCLGDTAVCVPDRGLVFERVTSFYCCSKRVSFLVDCVNSHNKIRMTHPLRVAKNCTTHPLPRVQKLMAHPLSAPAHPPPPYFLTSP